jgi:hypothetical protein
MIQEHVNMKYIESGTVMEHLSNLQDVINRLMTMKMILDDEM